MTTQQIIQYYGNLLILQYLSDTGVQIISTVGDVSGSLNSTFFVLANGTNAYLVWFNVSGGGTAPNIMGFTNIEVDITTGASATAVAEALSNALNAFSVNFSTVYSANEISLINNMSFITQFNGPFAIAGDYNTGFIFSKNNAVNTVELNAAGPIMNQLPLQVENAYNLNPTVQTITQGPDAVSGYVIYEYQGNLSAPIYWNSTEAYILAATNALFGISQVTVDFVYFGIVTITFNINTAPNLITVFENTLETSLSEPVSVTITTNQAQGVQLDVIGKYVGVTRSGAGSSGPITLDDAEFIQLIQIAIISNMQGSSLATIVGLLYTYFPGAIQVFDLANTSPMNLTYYINPDYISNQLLQLFIAEGLLPHPMATGISVILSPFVNEFFGCCDYATATPTDPNTHNSSPLNCQVLYALSDYNDNYPMLDYDYSYDI